MGIGHCAGSGTVRLLAADAIIGTGIRTVLGGYVVFGTGIGACADSGTVQYGCLLLLLLWMRRCCGIGLYAV